MKVASLFSGGKDSAYALYLALSSGWDVEYLVSVFPWSQDSWMFHYPGIELTKLQAKRIGIKHKILKTPGDKNQEVEDLKKFLRKLEIDGIVSGAVASEYQKQRLDFICEDLGIRSFSPLWYKNPETLLKEMIENEFKLMIMSVAAAGFNVGWLGRKIDERCIHDLRILNKKFGVHMSGEGGEFESIVLDCPLFSKPIKIKKARKIWLGNRGHLSISEAV